MAEYLNEKVMAMLLEVHGHQKSSYMHQIVSYSQYFDGNLYADERNGLLRELLCEHLMCCCLRAKGAANLTRSETDGQEPK